MPLNSFTVSSPNSKISGDANMITQDWDSTNTVTKTLSINDQTMSIREFVCSESKASDMWDIHSPMQDASISFSQTLNNTIYLKPRNKKNHNWISFFGTQIVTKGQYKRWELKILPIKKSLNKTAKVMIGVVDVDTLNERERGSSIQSEFWTSAGHKFGYSVCGQTGKKYHIDLKGRAYRKQWKVGDTINVELNRTSNRFIMHNDMSFYTNQKVDGMAFTVDIDRNYVLAVALCDQHCAIQIN